MFCAGVVRVRHITAVHSCHDQGTTPSYLILSRKPSRSRNSTIQCCLVCVVQRLAQEKSCDVDKNGEVQPVEIYKRVKGKVLLIPGMYVRIL